MAVIAPLGLKPSVAYVDLGNCSDKLAGVTSLSTLMFSLLLIFAFRSVTGGYLFTLAN